VISVQEWLEHLRWHYDAIQRRHQHGATMAIAVGGAFITSILFILSSIGSNNWLMVGIGLIGALLFGRFTYKAMIMLNGINNIMVDLGFIIKDATTGKLKKSNDIFKEYKQFLDKWDMKTMPKKRDVKKKRKTSQSLFSAKNYIFTIVLLAVVAITFSVLTSSQAEIFKTAGDDYRGLWITYHQKSLENQENENTRQMAEYFKGLKDNYDTRFYSFDFAAKCWQASFQIAVVLLMFIIVEFSIRGKMWEEWRKYAKSATILLLFFMLLMFIYSVFFLYLV